MIDTIAFAERSKSEGFTEQQARHLARLEIEREERIMTKNDLAYLATKQDISDLRAEMIKQGNQLTVRLGGMIALALAFLTAIKFFA
ncbi:hypothetical protein [Vreelandella zhaodongensis]|uniref:hypothetical protein n=1 Tax=Vreelandella zhaodongensis TaxID=1176240 RepID=UPI003EB9937F